MHLSVWKLPSSRFCVNGINGKRFYSQECHSADQENYFFYKPRSLEVPLALVKASQMRHKLQVTTETGNVLLKVFPCTSSAVLRNTGCCCFDSFWLLLAPWKLWRCEVWSLKRPHLLKKMCGSLDFANQQRVRASLLLGSIYRTKVCVQNRNDSPWSKG